MLKLSGTESFVLQVRNSVVRTLFQTLGMHGQKLSKSMWEDCLWNYVFPTLDRASHMVWMKLLEVDTRYYFYHKLMYFEFDF